MKITAALAACLLTGLTNAAAIARRVDIDIDQLENDCHNAKGRNDQARTAMITLTQDPNIAESLQGEFSIGDGERMAHSFDGACNHISSTEMKARGRWQGLFG